MVGGLLLAILGALQTDKPVVLNQAGGNCTKSCPGLVLEGQTITETTGIAEDIASAIFNPFVSSKKGSMGMGLAVTQRLVRSFGWTIGVRREDGRTVFGIEIPPARPDRSYYGSGP